MTTPIKSDTVSFTSKGQIVIPNWLRKEFDIQEGTKAIVTSTPDGILLKPVTAPLIRRGRGIVKRKPNDKELPELWGKENPPEEAAEGK